MQADLRLCCSQTPEDRFSRVEAHIKNKYVDQPVHLFSLIFPSDFKKIMLNSTEHDFILLINVKMQTIVGILNQQEKYNI